MRTAAAIGEVVVIVGYHAGIDSRDSHALSVTTDPVPRYARALVVLTGISPVLLVGDLERAVSFYRDQLGFACETYGDPANFATASRDQATLLLAVTESPERNSPHWQVVPAMWNAYIRADDVDEMYAEVQERGATIDYPIYDAPHGFREFGVQDPDGHDIAIGQPLDR